MNRRDDLKVNAVTQAACLILVICVGLCCNAAVFAQEKDSFSKTEAWEGHGASAKKVITETTYEDGSTRIQTRFLDPKGKTVEITSETKKPTGESYVERENFDSNGAKSGYHLELRSKGKVESSLSELYNNDVLI